MLSMVILFVCSANALATQTCEFFPEMDCSHLYDPVVPLGYSTRLENTLTTYDYSDDNRSIFFWTGGVNGGIGNTFVGFITSFYDAMRCGRRLVMPSTTVLAHNDLSLAFELGVPVADPVIEFGPSSIASDTSSGSRNRKTYPEFFLIWKSKAPTNITFKHEDQTVCADDFPAVQSRLHNYNYDRPRSKSLLKCHFRAVGCDSEAIEVPTKAPNYCGDSRALRRLVLGVNQRLLEVAPIYAATWMGPESPPHRFNQLLAARSSDPVKVKDNNDNSDNNRPRGGPVWDVAVHLRVEFRFVEQGKDEASHEHEISDWLQNNAIQMALDKVVMQVQKHFMNFKHEGYRRKNETASSTRKRPFAVYVASEAASVRAAVAALIRDGCPGAEVDYFSFSGTPHPDSRKDKSRNGQHQQTQTAAQFDYPAKRVYETAAALLEQKKQADLLFPYLEWWALAHSRFLIVRRSVKLHEWGSTFSKTAEIYGNWGSH